ncbi:actin-depolymerizing factor 3-like [Phragmites australis]|uniref:actin-depolymerizing factor 3-like n=1 Tax=Phragmites australis TaxID=29695 RepID=UPI002D7938F7|nr:actin-depolymerizing factor 3-like [Phragmites australis]
MTTSGHPATVLKQMTYIGDTRTTRYKYSRACCDRSSLCRTTSIDLVPSAQIKSSRLGSNNMANAASGVAVSDECKARFQELRTARAHRFVVFKVDDSLQQVVVDKVGARDAGFEDLTASLPADDCRYAVYDHDFTVGDATAAGAAESPRSKIFFISWSPATANVKSKMVYASSNEGFKTELDGVQIDLQATEPSELTLQVLKDHVSS